jgi:formamidopyrimidine-DNA glycosylase
LWVDGDETEAHPLINSLGPEPLTPDFSGEYLYQQIRTRTAPIKTTVMDSHLVVGVGNIYASESLFRARINPKTPANKLSKLKCEKLVAEIKATLAEAIDAGGSSLRDFFGADGNPGYFQQTYFVYGRTGEPCRNCQTPVLQIKQGQRSTFYCSHCQR